MVPGDAVTGLSAGRVARRLTGIGLGLSGWGAYHLLSERPELASAVAGAGAVPALMRGLSVLTAAIPLPLAEAVVLGVVLRQVVGAGRGLGRIRAGREPLMPALMRGGLRFAQDAGLLVFLFYLLWGFQYARPGLEAHLGIEAAGEARRPELRALAEHAVRLTNEAYEELHGSTDIGVPTPSRPLGLIVPSLETGWERIREVLDLPDRVARPYGAPKEILATPLVKRLGISGIYFPYTAEALVLNDLPGVLLGKELGHEMSHQRGFSSESDANVLGTLVALHSPDPFLRYAGAAFLQRQLVPALQRVSSTDAQEVAAARSPGVRRDLVALARYWQPAQTPVAAAASRVNDAMLRTHGVNEGVASYRGSTWVFVAIARERGIDALLPEAGS